MPKKSDKEVGQLRAQLARALADYQNLQKRIEKDSQETVRRLSLEVLGKLIPVLDILERAGEHISDDGLNLAIRQFKQALSESGVLEIEAKPKDLFDERIHEAVEVVGGGENGKIKEVVLKGYTWKDGTVIRPTKVKVFGKTEKKEELEKELLRGDYV